MSASFPNSWEPHGSSQQSQALGWRKPATRPAKQPTLSDRWKNAQARVLQSSVLPSRPTPSAPAPPPVPTPPPVPSTAPAQTQPSNLDLASFHQAEREHRILARYESIRSEVREVACSIRHLSKTHQASRDHHDAANKALQDELASLHGALATTGELVKDSMNNHITEERMDRIVQRHMTSMTRDIQDSSRALGKLDESYNRIRKDVNCLANGFFDRLAKHVSDDLHNVIDRQLIPFLDRRLQKSVDDQIGNFQALVDRMEDRIKIPPASRGLELLQGRFQSGSNEVVDARVYQEERLSRRREGGGFAMRSYGVGEGSIRRKQDQRVAHDSSARGYRLVPDSRDVVAGDGLTEARAASNRIPLELDRMDRGTQRTATPWSLTQGGSSIAGGASAHPVAAKVRIRQRVQLACGGSTVTVVDLTKTDESDRGEETSLFEERQIQRENVRKQSPKLHIVEPSVESDAYGWSGSEGEEVHKTGTRTRASPHRHKSPYYTRSAKKRRQG